MIRNGSSWTNRSWCWMWLEQRSVEKYGQLRLDFTNFHELKPFLKYIKGHKLKINFTLVEKWNAPGYIQFILKYMVLNFQRKKKVDDCETRFNFILHANGYIDVGDGWWRQNVLVTPLGCWWPISYVQKSHK